MERIVYWRWTKIHINAMALGFILFFTINLPQDWGQIYLLSKILRRENMWITQLALQVLLLYTYTKIETCVKIYRTNQYVFHLGMIS